MYLPRSLISHLYTNLIKTHHPLSPPVLILAALEPDALCACRILTTLLKRDYIPHKIKPIAGYGDLAVAGEQLVRPMRLADGGSGGVVVCLGVGGLVDLEALLGLEKNEDGSGGIDGVDMWILDARRPWNLANVFGGAVESDPLGVDKGQISRAFRPGSGGIIVFDDGDIHDELDPEREAWFALDEMPDIEDNGSDLSESDDGGNEDTIGNKRKRGPFDDEDGESEGEEFNSTPPPRQRRRSNSSSSLPVTPSRGRSNIQVPSSFPDGSPPSNQDSSQVVVPVADSEQPTARQLRRRLLRLRRKHDATLRKYHTLGTSYSEPISSLMYSLASELGREDNDLLWLAIVGVASTELYGRTSTGFSLASHDHTSTAFSGWSASRGSRIRAIFRDEVRRLNPPELTAQGQEVSRGAATDAIPLRGMSATDNSIRLSPEPRFLLIRHWSLYDAMLHSPYLSAKLHVWNDAGKRRLHKLLAKMGVSLTQCKQSYTFMDSELKQDLRERLLRFAPIYGLDALVPPASAGTGPAGKEGWGFVRTWGWKACLSAADVAVIVGAILEVGPAHSHTPHTPQTGLPTPPGSSSPAHADADGQTKDSDEDLNLKRFYKAYDSLLSPTQLLSNVSTAQSLHRAILSTGTALMYKRQIRNLRSFRLGLIKEGPDVAVFTAPGALTKLALWVGEAIAEMEKDDSSNKKRSGPTPLVLGCLDEDRGIYTVVGMGGGGGSMASLGREKEQERKAKQEKKEARRKEREERRKARRLEKEAKDDLGDGDEEDETESEPSDSDSSDSDSEDEDAKRRAGPVRNRFGNAFQEVVGETSARVRMESFEHCVVEVRKEDLGGFLEGLSLRAVVG